MHLPTAWDTPVIKQAANGLRKTGAPPRRKPALLSKDVKRIVEAAELNGDSYVAALCAIARLYLLRVPSEGIPLEWEGDHSRVVINGDSATITLMRRKNSRVPVALTRYCCCSSANL